MIIDKAKNGILIGAVFFIISYIFSSWWAWSFGCSFGARSFVEYLAIFSIPIAYIFNKVNKKNKKIRIAFWLIIVSLIVLNLKMIYSYDSCFFGEGNWDWVKYMEIIQSPTK